MIRLVLLLGASLLSSSLIAGTIDVEYKSFYSHVRKLEQEDTQDLQFAFGFLHIHNKNLCKINSAKIVTQKQTIPLDVTPEFRFTVPSEKALKLADALVLVDVDEAANKCDMSVQLETKPALLKQIYSKEELNHILGQYTAFFNEMGSFMSFLMPSVKGLMVHFSDRELTQTLRGGLTIQKGVLLINKDQLDTLYRLELPEVPLRVTALAKR